MLFWHHLVKSVSTIGGRNHIPAPFKYWGGGAPPRPPVPTPLLEHTQHELNGTIVHSLCLLGSELISN